MRTGADVIVQAVVESGRWYGRTDVLRRVEESSALGEWSYEVVDTKLARETKAGTILQLCLYSEIVGEVQARVPEYMHVVSPGGDFAPETFRVHDYLAYFRLIKQQLEAAVDVEGGASAVTYPEPVAQCDVCRWWSSCAQKRRNDDHLSLVAGISKLQRRELESRDTETLEALAQVPLPLPCRPERGRPDSYERVREQARIQLEGSQQAKALYELLPLDSTLAVLQQ